MNSNLNMSEGFAVFLLLWHFEVKQKIICKVGIQMKVK